MATRKIIDAKQNGEKVWLKGHAQAIFMSDGSTVEDAINNIENVDLESYATEEWVENKNYLTEHQNISHLATKAEIPTVPTKVSELENDSKFITLEDVPSLDDYASKDYVDNSIAELVDGAPETLNTLNELATALKDNADIVDVLNQSISSKQDIISDIETIRQGAAKGLTSVQQGTLSTVATSGSYNDLTNKPTIPNAVTESTVSGWGFTKNAGTYIKPSTGIPKTDLASAVQTSLAKADTALQTETYKGTITGVSANGTSVATSGVANIPAASTSKYGVTKLSTSTSSTSTSLAATASAVKSAYDLANGKQDKLVSGTNVKTINGESILGSGNIVISGGSSSSGSSAYSQVNHRTSDTTFALTPNTLHVWDEITELNLDFGSEIEGVANEYIFLFTSGSEPTTLILPDSIKFNSDFTVEANKIYQISILNGLGSVMNWDYTPPKKLITFTLLDTYNKSGLGVTTQWQAEEGMTWMDWANSPYSKDYFIVDVDGIWTTKFGLACIWEEPVAGIIIDGKTYKLEDPFL